MPEFRDGDLVLLDPSAQVKTDDVVVARHPFKKLDVIKYVDAVDDDGYLRLRSPGGEDSSQFGRVAASTVRGRVTINVSAARSDRRS